MSSIEEIQADIIEIEEDIESRKVSKAESAGAIKTYMKQLKDMYGLKSYNDIKDFIKDGTEEIEKTKAKILKLYGKVTDEYNRASNED